MITRMQKYVKNIAPTRVEIHSAYYRYRWIGILI